eukprot:515070-Rhodomonas_salina.1
MFSTSGGMLQNASPPSLLPIPSFTASEEMRATKINLPLCCPVYLCQQAENRISALQDCVCNANAPAMPRPRQGRRKDESGGGALNTKTKEILFLRKSSKAHLKSQMFPGNFKI